MNFVIQETPFSTYLTIRKSFNKGSRKLSTPAPQVLPTFDLKENEALKADLKVLQTKVDQLEEEKEALARKYEEEVNDGELLGAELKDETRKLSNLQANFDQLELGLKKIKSENKKLIETQHSASNELKQLKSEKVDLKSDINVKNVIIKTLKKEAKERSSQYESEVKKLKEAIEELSIYKVIKSSEEKALKNKQKKIDKKLKKMECFKTKHEQSESPEKCNPFKDFNENETDKNLEYETTVPTSNIFDCLNEVDIFNSDENLSHLPLLPTHKPFQVLNPTGSCDIIMKQSKLKSCLVPTSSLDPPCSLETISNQSPSNNSMATTTSKNPNILSSEDHLSPSEEIELKNMLKKLSVKVDAMNLNISEELKRK